jgi:hypothetical protein
VVINGAVIPNPAAVPATGGVNILFAQQETLKVPFVIVLINVPAIAFAGVVASVMLDPDTVAI